MIITQFVDNVHYWQRDTFDYSQGLKTITKEAALRPHLHEGVSAELSK
jgi:hypothetical protein